MLRLALPNITELGKEVTNEVVCTYIDMQQKSMWYFQLRVKKIILQAQNPP